MQLESSITAVDISDKTVSPVYVCKLLLKIRSEQLGYNPVEM